MNKYENKYLEKTSYADVYKVYDVNTGNEQGILYIKGLYESKIMKEYLKNDTKHIIKCNYNTNFKKWQPIFK